MRKHLCFLSLLLTACGQNKVETSDTSALVSQQQANEAFQIVQTIDYIPFTYLIDGCYARSLYMSLELAAEGIPSSAHYVFGALRPTSAVTWNYHVAPLMQLDKSSQEPWILDPAFEIKPLTRTQWLNKNFAASSQSSLSLADIARYTRTRIRAGSAYFEEVGRTDPYDTPETRAFNPQTDSLGNTIGLTPRPIDKSALIPTFEDMPTFLSRDIHAACMVLYSYLGRENNNSASTIAAKRNRLISSTTRLTQAMSQLGKLEPNGIVNYGDTASIKCRDAMSSFAL